MRRPTASLLLAAALLGSHLATAAEGNAQILVDPPTRAGFDWEMAPRFGMDADGDGRIELENSREYLHNRRSPCSGACPAPLFEVRFSATPSGEELGLPTSLFSYEWRLSGPAGPARHLRSSRTLQTLLPEGPHSVDLRVGVRIPYGRITLRSRGDILVQDLVVVALGDSYASGEGSPDRPRRGGDAAWADASDSAVEDAHALAHRSSVGWPVRVALALEQADPHTSVSFVSFASTSARIGHGVLEPRSDLGIPAQLDSVRQVVGGRNIDIVLLQVGGNDIGFSQVIRELVDADPLLDPLCYEVMVDNVWASARDGRWDRDVSLRYDPPFGIECRPTGGERASLPGLDALGDSLDDLAAALDDLDADRVVLVEYPDPTGSTSDGDTCEEIVGDVTPPLGFHEVDEEEQAKGRDRVLRPLNRELSAAADRLGWEFVGGVADAFASGHGYCAPWPDYGYPDEFERESPVFRNRLDHPEGWYRPPGVFGGPMILNRSEVSWYRTASQSAALQGPAPRFLTSGTMHPNELGHMAIARMVLAELAAGAAGV